MPSKRASRGDGRARSSPGQPSSEKRAASPKRSPHVQRSTLARGVGETSRQSRYRAPSKLTHACVITSDVEGLRNFYSVLLHTAPTVVRADYVEFATEGAALSLYDRRQFAMYASGAGSPGPTSKVMIEFLVDDVDHEYARLGRFPIEWLKPPSTQPWGNRSAYLRDPDGNLVNLYTRVDAGAWSSESSGARDQDTLEATRPADTRK